MFQGIFREFFCILLVADGRNPRLASRQIANSGASVYHKSESVTPSPLGLLQPSRSTFGKRAGPIHSSIHAADLSSGRRFPLNKHGATAETVPFPGIEGIIYKLF